MISFDAPAAALLDALATAPDDLPFGAIGLDRDQRTVFYNAAEAKAAGLTVERVLGKAFFAEVGPCMNNFMVAQRFVDEDALDDTIDYVLTLRMRPTRVRLRLLRRAGAPQGWLLVDWTAR